MSDGPHRSLPMSRKWKKVAECADKPAFSLEEIGDTIITAIEQDCVKEIPGALMEMVRGGLNCNDLFPEYSRNQLEGIRKVTVGYPLGCSLLDYVIQAASFGLTGTNTLYEAVRNALYDRAGRCARQVEEHYLRKSTRPRSQQVRHRIEAGIQTSKIDNLAHRILNTGSNLSSKIKKQDGLEDGPRL